MNNGRDRTLVIVVRLDIKDVATLLKCKTFEPPITKSKLVRKAVEGFVDGQVYAGNVDLVKSVSEALHIIERAGLDFKKAGMYNPKTTRALQREALKKGWFDERSIL